MYYIFFLRQYIWQLVTKFEAYNLNISKVQGFLFLFMTNEYCVVYTSIYSMSLLIEVEKNELRL